MASIPIFKFPSQFPGTEKIIAEREEKRINYDTEKSGKLWTDIKIIFKNPIWVLCCLGTVCENFTLSALISYVNKFLEQTFFVSPSVAGIGSAGLIIGALIGSIIALFLTNKYSWSVSSCK